MPPMAEGGAEAPATAAPPRASAASRWKMAGKAAKIGASIAIAGRKKRDGASALWALTPGRTP